MIDAILWRHSVSPKRLVAPAPDRAQVLEILSAAAAAPDHGRLRPWRFLEFSVEHRDALADVFEAALLERLPEADAEARERAREKAARAPLLLGLILRIQHGEDVAHRDDQLASGGAALQNVLLAAQSLGFGARALSGQAVRTESFRRAIGVQQDEIFLCFIPIGTPSAPTKKSARAAAETLLQTWTPEQGV